ncbi:uncharacterized protein J7T54_003819 [Emericellopsis cladophorae]|uniref:Uncharacterized protein n=1 Tax=Emericellopsis cladophorae TaxID=2686198 RepID=A0A9P9XTN3_9HYPO|nr:uncharacterized protein J7T54_003819 [Emericellopsis cladophorae]KAI6777611.1 hypothetical protein J7T54_003819 [Emericellopsis cladophorae]
MLREESFCADEYQLYLEFGDDKRVRHEFQDGLPAEENVFAIFEPVTRSRVVIECMLKHMPESVKLNMASAQVVLGLAPSVTAFFAPEAWQAGVIVRIGKHPLRHPLVLLLATASPILPPSLSSGSGLVEALLTRSVGGGGTDLHQRFVFPPWIYRLLSVRDGKIEGGNPVRRRLALWIIGWPIVYLLSLASLANVAHVIWSLYNTVLNFSGQERWLFVLWIFTGLIIHTSGALAVWPRLKRRPAAIAAGSRTASTTTHDEIARYAEVAADTIEMSEIDRQPAGGLSVSRGGRRRKVQVEIRPPSMVSVLLTWFTAMAAVLHLIFGTVIFSSVLLVSVVDAVPIALRLLASAIFSRIVMEYMISMWLRDVDLLYQPPVESGDGVRIDTAEETAPLSP